MDKIIKWPKSEVQNLKENSEVSHIEKEYLD